MIVYNALLDAYGKCGEVDSAYRIFYQMIERDIVSWTAMVVAYTKVSRLEDACHVLMKWQLRIQYLGLV